MSDGQEPAAKRQKVVKEEGGEDEDVQTKCVFVSGLSGIVSKERMREHFTKYGTVVSCDVVPRSSGCIGFVEFESLEHAKEAVNATGTLLEGAKITVQPKKSAGGASAKASKQKTNLVFVKFLDGNALSSNDIRKAFELCGRIKDLRVHVSKKYCFIEFDTVESATLATRVKDPRFQAHFGTQSEDDGRHSAATKAELKLSKSAPATMFRPRKVK
ncbi:Polyadenylate-binding protein-interacting protein 11 [Diplonema papillatum]|nr:Polyadenylate-binding protein-interacting protein 11 [Diplonema papillatum]